MRVRRDRFAMLGGAAMLLARAAAGQQAQAPIFYPSASRREAVAAHKYFACRDGLKQTRVLAGAKLRVAGRSADADYQRLTRLAAELSDPLRNAVLAAPLSARLPSFANIDCLAQAGGFAGDAPDLVASCDDAGVQAGRIRKGEKPADLPVEACESFKLVMNVKTATALRVDVAPRVLGRPTR